MRYKKRKHSVDVGGYYRGVMLCLLFLMSTSLLHAKLFRFNLGLKAGANYSRLDFNDIIETQGRRIIYDLKNGNIGFVGGAFFRFHIHRFYIEPQVFFAQDNVVVRVQSTSAAQISRLSINKIDVPVVLGVKIGKIFRIQAGLIGSYTLFGREKIREGGGFVALINNSIDKATWSYKAGIGFDIRRRISIDVNYQGSLVPISNFFGIDTESFKVDSRRGVVQINVGVSFLKMKNKFKYSLKK